MSAESWARVKAIFHDALDRPPAERSSFVRAAAGGDAAVVAEIESLLQAYESADVFLEQPAASMLDRESDWVISHRIGAYRVERAIGEGGMGTVYLAVRDDGQFRQRVAIKVLKAHLASLALVERFRAERQILADLEHPYIARLLDGGTTGEWVPYLVMEYVDGLAVDAYCAERRLPIPERLELLIKICAAVQYAHDHHVVHRDLKPGNILVTAEGLPKLLDFGIAKLMSGDERDVPAGEMTIGFRAMTPEYASPEQLRGEAATRATDVYALGGLCYRLLAERSPHRSPSSAPLDLAREVCETDPDPPGAGRDLDAVVLKAMARAPSERYASASDLAADLGRARDAEPVSATRSDRRGRVIRRAALATAVAALVLAAALRLRTPSHSSATPPGAVMSVAVMPFTVGDRGTPDAYLGAGVSDALFTRLGRIRQVTVRLSRRPPRSREEALAIGRAQHVETILDGAIDRANDRMKVTSALVRVSDGATLWTRAYDEPARDLLGIEDSIVQHVAAALSPMLTAADLQPARRASTLDREAHDLYLRGRYFAAQRSPDALRKSISYFEQAIARDPQYALAYAGLADAYALLGSPGSVQPARAADVMPAARRAAAAAVSADDALPEAHTSLGWVRLHYDWDVAGAEREFARAIALDPNQATARHWHAFALVAQSKFDDALAEIERARELDPLSLVINTAIATILTFAERYEPAIAQLQRTIELDPDFRLAQQRLGMALALAGRNAEAIRVFEGLKELPEGRGQTEASIAMVHALMGSLDTRVRIAALTRTAERGDVLPYEMASVLAAARDRAGALRWLQKALDDRYTGMVYLAADPRFKSLRDDAEFAALVRRVAPRNEK